MRLPAQADITLVSDRDYFLFKPNTIYIPFGFNPEQLKIGLEQPTKRKNISFVRDRVREIDPITKTVHTAGQKLSYDFLVVATGAGMYPDEVPGLHQ
jgi:sulfide:quinone oxidoreductase